MTGRTEPPVAARRGEASAATGPTCAECDSTSDVRPLDRLLLCGYCRGLDRCPECENGRAVEVAGPDPGTGFSDYACSVGCGWTG